MAIGIRELRVWQEAVALAGDVVRALRPASRREVAPLVSRIMATAFDAAAAIADGYARYDPGEQRRRYAVARRDLVRLDTELAAARHAELIQASVQGALGDRIQTVQRILGGYLVYLDRQLETPPGVTRLPVAGTTPAGGSAGAAPRMAVRETVDEVDRA